MLFFKTGYEWVGCQNKINAPLLGLLELTFEFEGVRNFSRIDVFVNNDYHKHIQVGSSYFQDAYFFSLFLLNLSRYVIHVHVLY